MSDDCRVVVIGSGPAGAMAAFELVRKGIPVTMLETGADIQRGTLVRMAGRNLYRHLPPMTKATGFVVTGDPETNLEYNYALGGLSNQWTGAVPRFCADDFTVGEQSTRNIAGPSPTVTSLRSTRWPKGRWRSRPIQAMFLRASESMGNHDSRVVDADSVD
jgi:choline dehydrogenase-like flavoprotein